MTDTPPAAQDTYAHELAVAERLARQAAEILLFHRRAGFQTELKTSVDDPVTVADREASELIVYGLRRAFPDDGILSEELPDSRERLGRERVWIIDPIDGTKEYVDGKPDYCVSIGLAHGGQAVLGVVLAPEAGGLYSGVVGQGVRHNGEPAGFSTRAPEQAVIAVSDTEYTRELHRYALPHMHPSGSIALKMARIAAGEADATFTMSPRSEWDIAAGMALVRASGGVSTRRNGQQILLGHERPHIERGILSGRPEVLAWLTHELTRLRVPEQVHDVTPADDVWPLAPEEARAAQEAGAKLHLRVAAGQLVAWALVRATAPLPVLERLEGEAEHAAVLKRDLVRIYGPLKE